MLKTSDYFSYFRSLAVSHKDLLHDPATETGNGPAGRKRFARFSVEEIISGITDKIKFPALLVDQFELKTVPGGLDPDELYAGALTVFSTADPESAAQIEKAFDESANILGDIIRKMYQDHEGNGVDMCNSPFERIFFDRLQIMPIGPALDSQFGWRCEFEFRLRHKVNITVPPAAGTFL